MGLNSRNGSLVPVKEESVDGFKDSGASWLLSNKVSALPAFKSFKSAQDEKMNKVMSDQHASPGFMAMSSTDSFDMKHQPGENFLGGATSKQQFIGGVPVAAPRSLIPSSSFVVGTIEPWFSTRASNSAAQLTIFYGGSVNVFEDITPEKAQAIMLLAGNVCVPTNMAQARPPVQPLAAKFTAGDAVFVNQTINAQPSSALSSPISVSSHPVGLSGAFSPNNEEVKAPKTSGVLTNVVNKVEAQNMVASLGPVAATTMIPSAVPQARKASLARFLEKRKERAMNSSPYNFTKKSAENTTPDFAASGLSATSIAGSSS